MKLYYAPGACSLAVHIALAEAGVRAELVKVDLGTHKTENGADFFAINPKGYVPALVLDNGEVLTEAVAILQYIADNHATAKLAAPAGTMARVRLQEMLNFIASEIHKTVGSLFNKTMPPAWQEQVRARAGQRLEWLAGQLAGKDYLMGDYSVADGYLFTVLRWTTYVGVDLSAWPVFNAYMARMAARSAVQTALTEEGLPTA